MSFVKCDFQSTRNHLKDIGARLVINVILRAALRPSLDEDKKLTIETNENMDEGKTLTSTTNDTCNYKTSFPKIIEFSNPHFRNAISSTANVSSVKPMNEPISKSREVKNETMIKEKDCNEIINDNPFIKMKKDCKIKRSNAYMKRNVYKSIIRHMQSFVKENAEKLESLLKANGFKDNEIEGAFRRVRFLNELEREKGNPRRSQATIKLILSKRTACTYILKETLSMMKNNWSKGDLGKISAENLVIYEEVCHNYYSEAIKILS